jgi:biopolymer transport protein ExbD
VKIRRREVPSEIPTTSMADVAFLLIIFFLVASFYSVTRGIQFSLPKHEEAAHLRAQPRFIEIQSTGALTVDGRALDLAGLPGIQGSSSGTP